MAEKHPADPEIEERTEIWKQVIITAGVVIVALIGAWQAIIIVQLNNKPPSPSPVPVVPTETPISPVGSEMSLPGGDMADIDTTRWYKLTNELLGDGFAVDENPNGKNPVITAASADSGQSWRFTPAPDPGYYTLSGKNTGLNALLDIENAGDYRLEMTPSARAEPGQFWQVYVSSDGCNRFTNELLGDAWSLAAESAGSVLHMARTTDEAGQCWHLAPLGPAN